MQGHMIVKLIKLLCIGSANDYIRLRPAPFPRSAQFKSRLDLPRNYLVPTTIYK